MEDRTKRQIAVTVDVYETILSALPVTPPEPGDTGIWRCGEHGEEILCPDEQTANVMAGLLEAAGYDTPCTGYYDPDEDQRSGETDDVTGYWYVTI